MVEPGRAPSTSPGAERRRFGVFEVDLATGELWRQGVRVALADQPFQLLAALLERPGEVVTREELRAALWPPGVHVDFDASLNAAVKKVRETLGDSARVPRFVETLPKRGYRFVAPVAIGVEEAVDVPRSGRRVPGWLWLLGAVLLLAVAGVSYDRSRRGASPGRAMLAVLPLDNLTADPSEEYFVDGVTEEILTHLGRLQPERLGVIARHSSMAYKNTDKPLPTIARELGVDYLLEGSVRRDRGRVRVTIQLIDASDQAHLWAENLDSSSWDLLEIQEGIAQRVARSLAIRLLPDEPQAQARAATVVTAAFDQYLRGQHRMAEGGEAALAAATAHFERAVELDPAFDRAWAGLATASTLQAFTANGDRERVMPRARLAAEAALGLTPALAEALTARGVVELYYDLEPAAAVESFEAALASSPNLAVARHWLGGALAAQGHFEEATAEVARAIELDPAAHSRQADLGWFLLFAGRLEEARRECDRVLLLVPDDPWALECRREASFLMGHWADAQEAARLRLRGMGVAAGTLARASALPTRSAFLQLEHLRAEALEAESHRNGRALELTALRLRLGDQQRAGEWLEIARSEREPMLVFLEVDPRFRDLGSER